ncbi:MAG: hypothetical protein IJH91_00565 [Mogibacterium sp.]|nr:hypothetical protein [Mogibacterium sp.]
MKKYLAIILIFCLAFVSGCAPGKQLEPSGTGEPSARDGSGPSGEDAEEGSTVDTEAILQSMTLEEKLCQMMMPSFRYVEYEAGGTCTGVVQMTPELEEFLQKYHFGGVIFFDENFASSDQALELIGSFRMVNEGNVPFLIGVDQEGGPVCRIPFSTAFSGNMALGATGSPEDIYNTSSIIGDELAYFGINTDFAPVVDVNSEPRNPVIGIRSFSDDPAYVAKCAEPYMKGLEDKGVIPVLKHFPGHGDTVTDSHTGLPCVNKTYEEIRKCELIPFQSGIDAGADMIMTAHIQYPQIETETYTAKDGSRIHLPATLSHRMITEILRGDLGYDGVVVSDALNMDAIKEYFTTEDVILLLFDAGVDMMLMPVDYRMPLPEYLERLDAFIGTAKRLVESGEIPEERVDASVRRILEMKARRGVFDGIPAGSGEKPGSREHHEQEMKIALDAVTVVENDGILPVAKDKKLLILAPYKAQVNSVQFALDAAGGRAADIYCYGADGAESFRRNVLPMVGNYDVVIAVSYMYDESDLNGNEFLLLDLLLKDCRAKGVPAVLISAHLPYDLARFDADAKLACYYASGINVMPGDYEGDVPRYGPNISAAILTVLGEGQGMGKLPVDIPEIAFDGSQYVYGSGIRYPRTAG